MPSNTAVVLNGQIGLLPSAQMAAGNGKYFSVTEPTTGTGVAYALQTGSSATANGFCAIKNTNNYGGANIYLQRLLINETATAPTGTLKMVFEVYNETGQVSLTGNVATRTPIQLNQGTGNTQTTGAVVQFFSAGAATVPAAVGTRILQDEIAIPTGVCVAHDTYGIDFGQDGYAIGTAGLTAARATDPATIIVSANPVIVPPQTTTWLNCYWITAAANVPSFLYKLTYVEL